MSDTNAHSIPSLAVAEHMLDRLLNVYGDPEVASIDHFMDEYTQQLKGFNAEELSEGCKILLGTFKYRRWPRPSECIDACVSAKKRIRVREKAKAAPVQAKGRTFNILNTKDMQFKFWVDHFESIGHAQIRLEALEAGEIAVSSKYPSAGMVDFIAVGPFTTAEPETWDGLGRIFDGNGRRIR